jgi:RNA polymerase sigma-70 factor (ECF subfamily)
MTDEEILLKYKIAESRDMAFKALVVKYQQRLYFHIRRMVIDHDDANDVLQNTFIKAWKGLENFREESQLFTWLYRIATNECLTFLAQKQRKFSYSLDEMQNNLANKLTADSQFDGNQLETKLQKAILTLPDKQRLVFNLRYYDEMPYEEMSNVLGTSEGALKASYHHAVKKIEAIIKSTD